MSSYTKYQNSALFFLRAIIGATFLYAASVKWPLWYSPAEGVSPALANILKFLSIVEPLGALAVAAGFLTRLAASGLAVIMVGAIFTMQLVMGAGFATAAGPGWNFPLVVLSGCVVLIVFGPGLWSADAKLEK